MVFGLVVCCSSGLGRDDVVEVKTTLLGGECATPAHANCKIHRDGNRFTWPKVAYLLEGVYMRKPNWRKCMVVIIEASFVCRILRSYGEDQGVRKAKKFAHPREDHCWC